MKEGAAHSGGENDARAQPSLLLRSVAEQLKLPLIIMARQAELGLLSGAAKLDDLAQIQLQSQVALKLLDSYLLGLELVESQTSLDLEPVSLSSTLVEVAHEIESYAHEHKVWLEINIDGRYRPVMAHPEGLKAALISLGYSLVLAEAEQSQNKHASLMLSAHRTPHGVVAGIYGEQMTLKAEHWRQALALCGKVRRPLTALTSNSLAGLFVADNILSAMSAKLRVGRYRKQSGLAITLQPSQQLKFL